MSFADILAIFTYKREANPKQRGIEVMKSVGKLAAGAAVFISGIDYSRGVNLFAAVLTPELEKQLLWDVLLHVKNLESRTLHEIEEVTARGQLHKVVFFPRRAIYNITPAFPVYISEIRPDEATLSIVYIEKLPGAGTPPVVAPPVVAPTPPN